jgi:hypothetical protein
MRSSVLLLFLVTPMVVGCQDRAFVNVGRGPTGNETGIPAESVDRFAEQQGVSRQEAPDYFRSGQARVAKAQ